MRFFCLILCLMSLTFSSIAEEIKAELKLATTTSVLKEGDIVEGIIRVWPIENGDFGEFKSLENTTLLGALFVNEIQSVAPSSNNADVIEIKAVFIIKKSKEPSITDILYKGVKAKLQVDSLNIQSNQKASKEYYIMNQGSMISNIGWIILGAFLVLLGIILYYKRSLIKKYIVREKVDVQLMALKKYREMFSVATVREDFEKIYAERKEWKFLNPTKVIDCSNFFEVMEAHQYKKAWTMNELNEVKTSFEIIKRSFE